METHSTPLDAAERIRVGNRTSIFGICCNVFLAASKLAIGLGSGMISIVADSVNNFSDAAASVISLVGFRLSARPADDEHPFGHARYEYISGLTIAFLVMMAGLELLKSSVQKILSPEEVTFSAVTFAVLVLSICVKFIMAAVYSRVGSRIGSETVLAAVLMYFTRVDLDGVMGAAVSLFVLYSGFGLVKDTVSPLLGTTPDADFIRRIQEKILSYEGVLGAHDLMIHDYGPGHCFASVHVEVPAEQTVLECHRLIDRIEQDFLRDENISLLIHYDPVVRGGSASPEDELQTHLLREAKAEGFDISIHDLKIADGRHVFFDCVIPPDERDREHEIIEFLMKRVSEREPGYSAAVKIDHGFVSLG